MSGTLFGGGKATSKPADQATPEAAALRSPSASLLARLLGVAPGSSLRGSVSRPGDDPVAFLRVPEGDPLAGVPAYTGQVTAPLSAGEQALLASLQSEGAGRQDLLARTMSGQFLSPATNPALGAAIEAAQRQVTEEFEEGARSLRAGFTRAGHAIQPGGSSPFDRAAAIASRGYANALADISARMQAQAYSDERDRQVAAVGLSQAEVDRGIEKLKASALPRLIQQHDLDSGLAEFQRRTEALLSLLQLAMGGSAPVVANQTKETQQGRIIQPIDLAGMVSGGLTAGFGKPPATT